MVRSQLAVRKRPRSPSSLSWAGVTVAPWVLATCLLMSFVADAGQDPVIGATRMDLTALAVRPPLDLIPGGAVATGGFALPRNDALIHEARLMVGDAAEIETGPDEMEPRIVLKPSSTEFPTVDRSRRSDPLVALRPTFDTRLRHAGSLELYRAAELAFGDNDPVAPPADFVAAPPDSYETGLGRLEPLPPGVSVTTRPSRAAASPHSATGSTTPHVQDGSTPTVARAVSLASTTPVASDSTPVEIAALPKFSRGPNGLVTANSTVVGIAQYHPDYAALIDSAKVSSEQRCLAEAIYFEARSEPEEGQAAVAQVVLNRVMSGLYPSSVCSVVFQNHQRRNACQFSFACEGHALHINEAQSWNNAVRIAQEVTEGSTYVSDVGAATHYHANYVRPTWARQLKKMDVIGHHIFYTLKPGQT